MLIKTYALNPQKSNFLQHFPLIWLEFAERKTFHVVVPCMKLGMNGLQRAFQVEQMLFNLVGLQPSAHKAQHRFRKLERE